VARFWCFWLGVARKNQRPLTLTLAEINGSPAILYWEEGRLAMVISLTLSAVGIQEIYALLNPEKLAYLQKQLSSSRRRSSFES
jgi:RNA polymerase sigma-70 factor, ECF subfamily